MTIKDEKKSVYAKTWDKYVTETFPEIEAAPRKTKDMLKSWQVLNTSDKVYSWPGDEWGDLESVQNILKTCVFDYLGDDPEVICELASGAGRFTDVVLSMYPQVKLECFDISSAFLEQVKQRFKAEIGAGRVGTTLLNENPKLMYKTLETRSLIRNIDCIFSFDAMVHVELHSLVIYIATAAAALKPGGLLTMNVADASNEKGLLKLIHNSPSVFRAGGLAGPQFQFTSPDVMRMVLERFGFTYEFHNCNDRDLFFSARLDDPEAAQSCFKSAETEWWFEN